MTKHEMISISRELLDGILIDGEDKKFNKKHYFMFCISKFLALKELVIKKDTKTNTLYFDDIKYRAKIPYILALRDFINDHGAYIKNPINIRLRSGNRDYELLEAIWLFNKLRDSIAHGKFSFDLENDQININNNEMSNPTNKFALVCKLPIAEFDFLTFAIQSSTEYSDYYNITNMYDKYVRKTKISNLYKYRKAFINEKYANANAYLDYIMDFHKSKYSYSDFLRKRLNKQATTASELSEESLTSLINYLSTKSLSNGQKKEVKKLINEYIENFGWLEKASPELQESFKKLERLKNTTDIDIKGFRTSFVRRQKQQDTQTDEYHVLASRALMQLRSVLNSTNVGKRKMLTTEETPVLVNHMIMLFQGESQTYPFLKTKITTPEGESTIKFDFKNNEQYKTKRDATRRLVRKFTIDTPKFISNYYELESRGLSPESISLAIRESFMNFYNEAIVSLTMRNDMITSSMRNAGEHVHLETASGYVHLWDTADKTKTDKTFETVCKITDLSEFLRYNYETKNEDKIFTDDDFIYELTSFIDDEELSEKFKSTMKIYEIFIQKSLLIALRNVETQKRGM